MENVFAITLTALPDVPYWRAAGTTGWGLDCCMVIFSTDVNEKKN